MGELAGILGIISAFAVSVDLFLIFYIWWEYIKLNEVLSIYLWAAREGVYSSMKDFVDYYNGELKPSQIIELKAYEWQHVKNRNGKYYSKRPILQFLKRHEDSDHLSIYGFRTRTDGKDIGEEKLRTDD